jgi:alanyl-tRNA synthetase
VFSVDRLETDLNNTCEIEFVKIIHVERVQDGVEKPQVATAEE